jgi:hypothetical protein
VETSRNRLLRSGGVDFPKGKSCLINYFLKYSTTSRLSRSRSVALIARYFQNQQIVRAGHCDIVTLRVSPNEYTNGCIQTAEIVT